jgi:hypothetical protein
MYTIAPACGVSISQFIRYARGCSFYSDYSQRRRIKSRIFKEVHHFIFQNFFPEEINMMTVGNR